MNSASRIPEWSRTTFTIAVLAVVAWSATANADFTLDTTLPAAGTSGSKMDPANGDDYIILNVKTGANSKDVTVHVVVPAGTKDRGTKLDLIAAALTTDGYTASRTGQGVSLSKSGPAGSTVTKVSFVSKTGEGDTVADNSRGGNQGSIAYAGSLSGKDYLGALATYASAIGYDGFSAHASFTAASLSAPTLDGLLTDTFNSLDSQLPASLRGDLRLDRAEETISFDVPSNVSNPFVTAGTTDFGLSSTASIGSPVPEPGTALLGVLGLAGIAVRALAVRRSPRRPVESGERRETDREV